MADTCTRNITFTIPGKNSAPDVSVSVTEDNGVLLFSVNVLSSYLSTADLRGLFFNLNDDAKLSGLSFSGSEVSDFDTLDVIDLGHGANMRGGGNKPFDVGLEFGTQGIGKDDIQSTTFTLTNTAGDLTLDDIANVQFGARLTSVGAAGGSRGDSAKLVVIAPAAPDARDDAYEIFEDGQTGLDSPSSTPIGTIFEVLANDTDADGDTLTITNVHGALHGTVEIVDGQDADSLPGDAVLYTPFEDYSGEDNFTYCITDNNGGTDFATAQVAITAVADVPYLSYETFAGDTVDTVIVRVTTFQTDADSSEYIDRIELSGIPDGVSVDSIVYNPTEEVAQIVRDFTLTLPTDQDTNFDLGITSFSKETSNGDEESSFLTVPIIYEYNSTTTNVAFAAEDQSIWNTGDQFTFVDDRFVGVDTGYFNKSLGGSVLYAGIDGHIQLGFQSTLTFEGGEIDATSNYNVTVETNYNKTVDKLLIDTSALITSASFSTEGPEGSYVLDFLYDVLLNAYAGVNIDFGSIDFDPLGIIPGDQTLDLGGINEQINFPAISIGPGSENILELNSETFAGEIEFPDPLGAFSVNYAWPNITTNGTYPDNPVIASGSSNNFLELNIDIDDLVTQLLGIPNVIDPPEVTLGPIYADVDFLDVDVTGGLNFLQDFEMQLGELTGALLFENGSSQLFTVGDSLLLENASLIDAGGDNDGLVEFAFAVVPTATLSNETFLGFNIGAEITLFQVEVGYDIEIWNPFGDNVHFDDSIVLGPLADFGETVPVDKIEVFDDTFALAFGQEFVTAWA